ncbi:hypothetical protein [Moorella sp. E306M]|uniref:hypothetical protein n=1 Tax=Moorella sp. E306M TaxID=2572683 RepID=UPI0010FFC053|nr:hypothetical protein [Moorella sp. E306M]GEA17500.1 hypothetical protein E306M_06340 [Moorella sp. E306M]
MRATIRQMLIEKVPQVQGRVYEPHVANPGAGKPFLVVREGVQDRGADWAAFSTVVEVWPYVDRTTFQQVDALAGAVINVLHRARFTDSGEQYLIDYLGTVGQDFADDDWDAITRGLRFRVFALGWLNGLTYDPDPVSVMRSWTAATWPEVQTDPATWSPADTAPGVYWRLVRLTPVSQTQAVNWIEAQITGHVLAPSPAVRLSWVRKITEGIVKQRRLKMLDGGPLELLRVAADSEADPMRQGQVQLTARFGVLQPAVQAVLLSRAVVGGALTGEVT